MGSGNNNERPIESVAKPAFHTIESVVLRYRKCSVQVLQN